MSPEMLIYAEHNQFDFLHIEGHCMLDNKASNKLYRKRIGRIFHFMVNLGFMG